MQRKYVYMEPLTLNIYFLGALVVWLVMVTRTVAIESFATQNKINCLLISGVGWPSLSLVDIRIISTIDTRIVDL